MVSTNLGADCVQSLWGVAVLLILQTLTSLGAQTFNGPHYEEVLQSLGQFASWSCDLQLLIFSVFFLICKAIYTCYLAYYIVSRFILILTHRAVSQSSGALFFSGKQKYVAWWY